MHLFSDLCALPERASPCSVVKSLDESLLVKIVPSVDLEISVDLGHLGLDKVLVAGNDELLSVVGVVIWRVHDETELGHLSAIGLLVLEVIDHPSR